MRFAAVMLPLVIAGVAYAGTPSVSIETDRVTFESALGGSGVNLDFDALPVGATFPSVGSTALGGIATLETSGGESSFIYSDGAGANGIDGTPHLDMVVAPESQLLGLPEDRFDITFAEPVFAVGFDYADFFSSSFSDGVDVLVNGEVAINTLDLGLSGGGGVIEPGFIGFLSFAPIDSIGFRSPEGSFGETFGIDNLIYQIPAPGTLAVLGLAAFRRRRRPDLG
ncbi:MAG: hypothetical protein AAGG07_09985 [Planctomycetota bacterium]